MIVEVAASTIQGRLCAGKILAEDFSDNDDDEGEENCEI